MRLTAATSCKATIRRKAAAGACVEFSAAAPQFSKYSKDFSNWQGRAAPQCDIVAGDCAPVVRDILPPSQYTSDEAASSYLDFSII